MRGARDAPAGVAACGRRPESREPTLAALVLVALDVFVLVLRLTSFADEVCEERTTYPAAPQQATADQQPCEPMLAALALALALVALDVLVVLVLRLTSFAEQMCEEGTTYSAAPQQTAADQQPREPTLPVRTLFAQTLLALVAVVLRCASLTQQMSHQQPAKALLPQDAAASQQAYEPAFAAPTFTVHLCITLVALVPMFCTQEFRQEPAA